VAHRQELINLAGPGKQAACQELPVGDLTTAAWVLPAALRSGALRGCWRLDQAQRSLCHPGNFLLCPI